MRSALRIASIAFVSLCVHACHATDGPWCIGDGAEVVLDPSPSWSPQASLERLWHIDGSEEGRELIVPSSVAMNQAANRVAVVDFHSGDVVVASLDGQWIGRWGRRGEGPGEIGHALTARWTPEGKLDVYDPVGSKLVQFDSNGAAVGEEQIGATFTAALGGGIAWISFAADGSLLARPVGLSRVSEGMMEVVVLRTNPAGTVTDTLVRTKVPALEPEGWMPFVAPNWPVPHAAVSPSGDIAISGEQLEYRVRVLRADSADLVICRQVSPRPPGEPTTDVAPEIRATLRTAPDPDRPAAVGRVAYDESGRLWVQRDLPNTLSAEDAAMGREGALFDVYEGRNYLGDVQFPDRVRFLNAAGDMVVAIQRGEFDEYSLVAFRLVHSLRE